MSIGNDKKSAIEEIEKAIREQEKQRDNFPEDVFQTTLEMLQAKKEALVKQISVFKGPGAVAQGNGAVAAGAGGIAVGGNVKGNIIVGNNNVISERIGQMQTGGIRADRIDAENIVDGVQVKGGDAQTADSLVALAREIRQGGISAGEIKANNLVSGLQYLSDTDQATPADLLKEIAVLREQVEKLVSTGEIPDAGDAEDVQDALVKAEKSLSSPEPEGSRVVRKLDEVSKILTKSAETLKTAGEVKSQIFKLAPYAAALWAFAKTIFGV